MRKYSVIWKGEKIASLTRVQIAEAFARGKYGYLHSVEINGKVLPLAEFLDGLSADDEKREAALGKFDFRIFGFCLCGLAFLSLFIYGALMLYAFFLYLSRRTQLASLLALLGSLMALAGWCFFKFIVPSL